MVEMEITPDMVYAQKRIDEKNDADLKELFGEETLEFMNPSHHI